MSIAAIDWVLRSAPVADPTAKLILIALADHAANDGSAAWPSQATIAEYACCSERSVRRRLLELESVGLIYRGDQRLVANYRADRRPIVWNLAMAPREDSLTGRSDLPRDSLTGREDPRGDTGGMDGGTPETERGDTGDRTRGQLWPTNRPLNRPITVLEPSGVARARATRLAEDWKPGPHLLAWAAEKCPDVNIPVETSNFKDYWLSVPDSRGRMLSWDRTFQRWMRKEQQHAQSRNNHRGRPALTVTHTNSFGELWEE